MKKIYDKDSLLELLQNIDNKQGGYIKPYIYDHRDAIMINNKCTFISKMPFSGKQYLYIDNGAIAISTYYNPHKKSIYNQVETSHDFFKAFSKLKLDDVEIMKDILPAFPEPEYIDYSFNGYYDYGYDCELSGDGDENWNSDLETYTIDGK